MFFPLLLSAQVNDNFEDGNITGWTESTVGHWSASDTDPINGTYSLKHTFNSSATDKDYISTPIDLNLNSGNTTWQFQVKYEYNPSASNYWIVYFASDNDASGIESANAYAIGIYDDKIRFWHIADGLKISILVTDFNWQTEVGTSTAAGFQITRSETGDWDIKIDKDGGFDNLVSIGTTNHTTFTNAAHFVLTYFYTTTADQKLFLDDLSIEQTSANPNNLDTKVEAATTIPAANIPATALAQTDAVDVLNFKITDLGTSDGLPTHVTHIKIKDAMPTNGADWANCIGGAILKDGENVMTLDAPTITNGAIDFSLTSGQLDIADGSNKTLTLAVWLKSGAIEDGKKLQFMVDETAHGFSSTNDGSGFAANFPAQVLSSDFTLNVVADRIAFSLVPEKISLNSTFEVSATFTDVDGNIDVDASQNITLSLNTGTGNLGGTLAQTPTNGICSWTDLTFDGMGEFTLKATTTGLTNNETISSTISVTGDETSIVKAPETQIPANTISSITDTYSEAVDVFKFKIKDLASGDDQPTNVALITIKNPQKGNDAFADWSNNIQNVTLNNGSKALIISGNAEVKDDYIKIPVKAGELSIADGDSLEITMGVFLNEKKIEDGKKLQFQVAAADHGWISENSGSGFAASFPAAVLSEEFTIETQATQLSFTSTPKYVGVNKNFEVTISATDENKNIDVSATNTITITREAGTGTLSTAKIDATLSAGSFTWENLTYDKSELFTIIANTSGLNSGLSSVIYAVDNTSILDQASSEIAAANIFALKTTPEEAIEVFRFAIKDLSTTDDLSTKVKTLVIKNASPENSADWTKNIGGIILKSGSSVIEPKSVTINQEIIDIDFEEDILTVNAGETKEITLSIYLKERNIQDGKKLQFMINADDHDCITYNISSAFAYDFPYNVFSQIFTLQVEASRLEFTSTPAFVEKSKAFAATVAACDANHNIDINSTNNITLQKASGTGNLTGTLSAQLSQGKAIISDLKYDAEDNFNIKATDASSSLPEAVSSNIMVNNSINTYVSTSFETGGLSEWQHTDDWIISSFEPITGDKSLKHNLSGIEGESYIVRALPAVNLNSGTMNWRFNLKNGNFDPYSSRGFWFWLSADKADLNTASGYAVGVNLSGSTDLITLWKVSNGEDFTAIITSDFDWNANTLAGIEVTRTTEGEWSLKYDSDGNFDQLVNAGTETDTDYSSANFCGLQYKYTSSAAGYLWFDDLEIRGTNTAPEITKITTPDATSVEVIFSEAVEETSAETLSNYSITHGGSNQLAISAAELVAVNKVKLTVATMTTQTYSLTVSGVKDLSGLEANQTMDFNYSLPPVLGDVVINEIMADPSDPVGLPNHEYVELHNNKNYPIDLSNWKIIVGSSSKIIPENTKIEASGYVLLCSNDAVGELSQYGTVVGITSFPALPNSGKQLMLKSSEEVLISSVNYSDSWYQNPAFDDGGYSLERIDPTNLCGTINNWKVSEDAKGGTPCSVNSINAPNQDTDAPTVLSVSVSNEKQLIVQFSELLEKDIAETEANYQIPAFAATLDSAVLDAETKTKVTLFYNENFTLSSSYTIKINNISDLCGNAMSETSIDFTHYKANPNDIVINEIMPDPSPVVNLPEAEFIELYNHTNQNIDLSNWMLTVGSSSKFIPAGSIEANGYVILCSTSAIGDFQSYGNVIAIPSFPSLTNSGSTIEIRDNNQTLINKVTYSVDWYQDSEKDDGGWTLEKIDYNNTCGTFSNWKASVNANGGTPGSENSIYAENVDNTAPNIKSVSIINSKEVKIIFTENVTPSTANNIDNYIISSSHVLKSATINEDDFSEVTLTYETDFEQLVDYNLTVKNIDDECGNAITETSVKINYYIANPYDILINEIMADPSPVIDLPEYEYVELYNTTDKTIDLSNWQICAGTTCKTIESGAIKPNEYLILCKKEAETTFSTYGNTIGMESFISITNSAQIIKLVSAQEQLISLISFTDDWYQDSYKAEGGWSLEQIDVANPCGCENNWIASNDKNGGTPGKENSVKSDNPDNVAPKLTRAAIVNDNTISIFFNEPLDITTLTDVNTYEVEGIGSPTNVTPIEPTYKEIHLKFNTTFTGTQIYTIKINGNIKDCVGNEIEPNNTANFTKPQEAVKEDIVINEILFNPLDDGVDYVELYNRSQKTIDLSELRLATKDDEGNIKSVKVISEAGYLLFKEQYVVLTTDVAKVNEQFKAENQDAFIEMESMPSFSNEAGRVLLMNKSEETIDDFIYNEDMHFDLLTGVDGVSLERVNFNNETNNNSNWHSAAASFGYGTPTYKNSQFKELSDIEDDVKIDPEVFSPDGDGSDDFTNIQFKFESGYAANISIYDSRGRLVRHLANNELISADGSIKWDGKDNNGKTANVGIYIVYIEVYNGNGDAKEYKKTCVLAKKF